MSNLAITAGRKVFERNLKNYTPTDPLYETYTDKKGRQKRRTRATPPGLSKRDAKILRSVQRRAHYLDKGFNICGMRFGWTFIIGIIPGAGDIADASLNYFLVVRKARQAEIPSWLLRQMLLNNAVSAAVGLIPFVGDIVLATYKANSRNAALLEEFLRTVRPGAGREADEVVPGKKPERGLTNWLRRGSKGGSKKEKGAAADPPPTKPSADRGRFVEDVPASSASEPASKTK
ncbi:uncharacterized protein BXZ73DRAFT_96431 [Epithele typhae]|uniref:uncharacterized protein n=1 Tax=Epithele typhae TaxID=378194 RepID=UPI002008005B|nr:uncharacterized protein BXZ73DRAFT_96431 [Epithele typhae]KAH9945442.1 hypothetical protein BXZ73DRAFT_96431 [Epithele typhae]